MGGCCKKTNNTTDQTNFTAKKLINTFKSSIFCGAKGFLTFNLALLSYAEYSLYDYMLSKSNNQEDNRPKIKTAQAYLNDGSIVEVEEEVEEKKYNSYKFLKEGAAFAMKRNTIPFIEMIAIVPLACFALPVMIPGINILQCALICIALMVATCFIVRSFNLREKLLEKQTDYTREEIDKEFTKDSIVYPIFNKDRKHIQYNSPDQGHLLSEKDSTSFLVMLLAFPLKILQSCILVSLAVIELLEAVPNLCVDMIYDRSFDATKSNLQRSGNLLYASARNVIPVLSKFDEPVAEFIGIPKASCCSV
ncbi:hypothetical protein [Wolbachia endosymbiont of Folsomia candida]|uniref:hypothetical protein n=1 Tax=Wolbachia endosymbiont of Folsomia candida TaxID=169402 RepID=UPI000A5049D5|nr:hypothetical protein [Wolbachia endosymbiont of Folsomia candida]APR98496.1 hypothetical protein ASM33_04500 [Wolbachia endosymbiont of Folsomia candida]